MRSSPLRLAAVLASCAALAACPAPPRPDGGVLAAPPTVTGLAPAEGPTTGGTLVVVSGADFEAGASVWFGDRLGLAVVVDGGAELSVTTPPRLAVGPVPVVVVNPNGASGASPVDFRYTEAGLPAIDDAWLANEAMATETSGAPTVAVTVRGVVAAGASTAGPGRGPGLRAQVGFAEALSSPPVASDFAWFDAAYAGDVDGATPGDLARDTYQGTVLLAGVTGDADRTYTLAVRFLVEGRTSWLLADIDGAANGVGADQLARLSLTGPSVDWCRLGAEGDGAPPTLELTAGLDAGLVTAHVARAGVTDAAGAGSGLLAEVGVGAPGTPTTSWTWAPAGYVRDGESGATDEYAGVLPVPSELGAYVYAVRFRAGSRPWAYCDGDGSANGFDVERAGQLEVRSRPIDRCVLQPLAQPSLMSGDRLTVRLHVLVQDSTTKPGAASGLRAQLGVGPADESAGQSVRWAWRTARFSQDVPDAGADEYVAVLTPAFTGPTRAVAGRASVDDGGSWTFCDLDGSDNGFTLEQQARLSVGDHTAANWCNTQSPASLRLSQAPTLVFGRVSKTGVAPNSDPPLVAELGVGPRDQDPGVSEAWRWWPADHNPLCGAPCVTDVSNEYARALAPEQLLVGGGYAFRFSADGGAACYGDLNASNVGGFASGNLGVVQ